MLVELEKLPSLAGWLTIPLKKELASMEQGKFISIDISYDFKIQITEGGSFSVKEAQAILYGLGKWRILCLEKKTEFSLNTIEDLLRKSHIQTEKTEYAAIAAWQYHLKYAAANNSTHIYFLVNPDDVCIDIIV